MAAYFLEIALILFLVRILLGKILGYESRIANYIGIFAAVVAIITIVFPFPLDLFTRFIIFVGFILVTFIAVITSQKENPQPITVIVKGKETIVIHKENLIKAIPETPTIMGLFSSNGWIGWIDNFPHRRKLLEHLYTGHRELFNLLDSVMTSKDENKGYERITFNQKFSTFLNNIKLDPNNLKGACKDLDDSGCLQYYDENDSKEYRAKLVEMNNINWINKSS